MASSPPEAEALDVCWICLDDDQAELFSPCTCPRKAHAKCLARWQLQQAGRPEETHCRFCASQLADWKVHLTPDEVKNELDKVQVLFCAARRLPPRCDAAIARAPPPAADCAAPRGTRRPGRGRRHRIAPSAPASN